ncbi:ParA family protein [Chitinimonas sp.]|uniref:ParA family protein n=1 Tax=Chitinimonas sp. TaxID=1934313 RepID=UPI002F926576
MSNVVTTIMVANPKGGCGKSTVSIHLASWFAQQDELVCLGDLDRQQSAMQWLASRPVALPHIRRWKLGDELPPAPPPSDCRLAVLDTPAGLHGKPLKQLLSVADYVVVPVTPSAFDMRASQAFFEELAEIKAVRKEKVRIGTVGMRLDPRTRSAQQLVEFLGEYDLPLLACVRDAQRYVQVLQAGMSLFDLPSSVVRLDREQWRPLLDWLVSARSRS